MAAESRAVNLLRAKIDHDRLLAESTRLDCGVSQSGSAPNSADDLCRRSQSKPDHETKQKPNGGQNETHKPVSLMPRMSAEGKLTNGGKVYPHESEKRAEVHELGRAFVVQQQCTGQHKNTDDPEVERWIVLFVQARKKLRQSFVPSHSKKQPRCA